MPASLVVASVVDSLVNFAAPWKHVYDHSKALSVAVIFLHLASLLVGGGIALAMDRTTLRLADEAPADREWHLVELGRAHGPVIASLALSFATGVLLFLADVETFAVSAIFWGKMALVALLLVNGLVMQRAELALRRAATGAGDGGSGGDGAWARLRRSARLSGALWLLTLLAGTALTNA